ncbi:unnamed protein product [Danaus chrysippus]|uniref:(African queen) hypothetical protein n=1 Tax=Danaus chrysippus TaxID=151541 RepID=A0A8J2R3B3_9NEOP|nr:unnamed protein product [Danaus chrysippus]
MYIKTFVVFDINTVGYTVKKRDNIKIVEFTLMEVPREVFEKSDSEGFKPSNTMTQSINPQVTVDVKKVKSNPRLSADNLKNHPIFRDVIKDVNKFLEDLPKPVCLVSLHGNRFDLKVLLTEYKRADETFPSDVLCVDSKAFFSVETDVQPDPIPDNKTEPVEELNVMFGKMTTKGKDKLYIQQLYRSLLKKEPPQSQTTEVKTDMHLRCLLRLKGPFLLWVDKNAKPISVIKPFGKHQDQPAN